MKGGRTLAFMKRLPRQLGMFASVREPIAPVLPFPILPIRSPIPPLLLCTTVHLRPPKIHVCLVEVPRCFGLRIAHAPLQLTHKFRRLVVVPTHRERVAPAPRDRDV